MAVLKKNHVKKDTCISCTQSDFYQKNKIKQKQNKPKHKKTNKTTRDTAK